VLAYGESRVGSFEKTEKRKKKPVDFYMPDCYTIKAVAGNGSGTGQSGSGSESERGSERHLENYIVQETKTSQ